MKLSFISFLVIGVILAFSASVVRAGENSSESDDLGASDTVFKNGFLLLGGVTASGMVGGGFLLKENLFLQNYYKNQANKYEALGNLERAREMRKSLRGQKKLLAGGILLEGALAAETFWMLNTAYKIDQEELEALSESSLFPDTREPKPHKESGVRGETSH